MQPSEYVPLATITAGFITSLFALWTGSRASRMSWHTAYTTPRLEAVMAYLDAVDAFTKDPQGGDLDAVRSTYEKVRLVFFCESALVALAEEINATCAALRSATRTDLPKSYFHELELMATRYSGDSDQQRERVPRYEAMIKEIKEIRALQDTVFEAGEPAPDITARVAKLVEMAPPGPFSDKGKLLAAIGNAKHREEVSTRRAREAAARTALPETRSEFVGMVSMWLREPGIATRSRHTLPRLVRGEIGKRRGLGW
ncbi:hypothetical protein NRK68_34250 (plasmid) [Streptomyces yangpuensis]|uniref:Uncharacterized protein n=1 Tax=Streptomyces yangpuensis TaxID=1648182 RepID=A0ABY5Q9J8_9ACTN|nr:hypothetical protein [Streptomyces yangpuensis]UUY52340.1 hypothetical protein NRK68_34250 [Streptomyces yangpuensis]